MNNLNTYNYIFFRANKSIFDLTEKSLKTYKEEFVGILEQKNIKVNAYSTVGLKGDISIMLWIQSESVDVAQDVINQLMHSGLGRHLEITYTLFGIKRRSSYGNKGTAESQEVENTERSKYLVVYPFTKIADWYQLDFEKRRELMHEHIKIGYKYAHIKQHLLYATGLDDHEFIVAYETEDLEEFQSLVIDMRSTKVRIYTLSDTPIFTCIHKTIQESLNYI